MIECKDVEFKMIISKTELKIKFIIKFVDVTLPANVHLGGLIFEQVKQVVFTRKWFIQEYMKIKRHYNV